jgi:hypothetical protein
MLTRRSAVPKRGSDGLGPLQPRRSQTIACNKSERVNIGAQRTLGTNFSGVTRKIELSMTALMHSYSYAEKVMV